MFRGYVLGKPTAYKVSDCNTSKLPKFDNYNTVSHDIIISILGPNMYEIMMQNARVNQRLCKIE